LIAGGFPAVAVAPDWPGAGPIDLAGKVVLLVGASGGLGQAAALELADAGAEVVLAGRRVAALEQLYDRIDVAGGKVGLYPLNLAGASPADYAEMAERLRNQCGGLDALVFASAHLHGLSAIELTSSQDWLTALHVNLAAPVLLVQACLPLLRARSDAAIVLPINGPATCARAYWGGYGVAQAGLAQLAAILSDELERTPVRVHGIDPGPMRTGLRQRVWFGEDPATVPSAQGAARAVAALVSGLGTRFRGQLLRLHA
jgi:NAD(P)-dependent dehydrogenase (short-subunit alcohol dehydrogenase family)